MIRINLLEKEKLLSREIMLVDFKGSICDFIADVYKPGDAFAIYSGTPCIENDVTLEVLESRHQSVSEYTIIETPSAAIGVAGWLAIISIVISVAAIALAPKPKIPGNIRREQESPNNGLGSRSNQARPLQRIPDIRGTVKAIPDIIMPPYRRYYGQTREVEIGFYCIGRGTYSIDSNTIKDGDTPVNLIEGASVQVYGPNKSPNNSAPDIQVGSVIEERIVAPYRSNQVDGIDLVRPSASGLAGITADELTSVYFDNDGDYPGYLLICIPEANYSDDYYVGNKVVITEAEAVPFVTSSTTPWTYADFNLNGIYEILAVTYSGIGIVGYEVLIDLVNPLFDGYIWNMVLYPTLPSFYMVTEFGTPYDLWNYVAQTDQFDRGYINILAPNGLYRDDGTNIYTVTIEYEATIEPVSLAGEPSGTQETITFSMTGNSQTQRGITVDFTLPYKSAFRIKVKRTTDRISGSGAIVDSTKLADLYGLIDINDAHFGDITTILTRTMSTKNATSARERQLSCIATEMLYKYNGGGFFAETMTENDSAVQSYIKDFIDPVFGNKSITEVDADGLIEMENDIVAYFGDRNHVGFCFTLDSTDITFQEYTQILFNAINAVAYRDGSIVKAHFEKPETIPSMLFTHRSKIPGSETYSRNMNLSQLSDGIEFKWTDPDKNTVETIYIPSDRTAQNPKRLEMAGFRNYQQAYKRAWREYQKLTHEKIALDMTVTADGRYLKPGNVFSAVKGTRTQTTDGEVTAVSVDGYTLTLSQNVQFTVGDDHYIILKNADGSTESILCTAGTEDNQVVLNDLPTNEIRTSIDYQRRTEFSFGNEARHEAQLFIARSIDTSDVHTVRISAVNYTDAYYSHDNDALNSYNNDYSNDYL